MNLLFDTYSNHLGELLNEEDILSRITNLAYCLTDEKGFFIEVNEAYCALYGYSAQELIGQHFTIVVPNGYKEFASGVHDAFISGVEEMPAIWTVQNKKGELLSIHAEAIRCKTKEGNTTKMTLIELLPTS